MAGKEIPDPIRFDFLERAQTVCDLAKVDYWEHIQVLSELREQMEASYRLYDQAGLYKDDAAKKALEDFGSPKLIAKVYRDGWRGLCNRLVLFKRYALYRLLSPVIFCLFHTWLRSEGSMEYRIISTTYADWRIVLFGWDYYIGIIIVVAVLLAHLIPPQKKPWRFAGNLVATAVTLAVLRVIVCEWWASVLDMLHHIQANTVFDHASRWGNTTFGCVLLCLFLLEAVAFFVVLALVGAEIFDLSDRRKNRLETRQRLLA